MKIILSTKQGFWGKTITFQLFTKRKSYLNTIRSFYNVPVRHYNLLTKYVQSPQINEIENTKLIGQVLYTDYFYLFQISGLILLVAMVGSITLTLRDRGQVKRQNISSQNFIDAKNAIQKKKIKLGEGI